jgi:hypothetical protein
MGSIMLDVRTKDADFAGTDSVVTATIVRDGKELYDLTLDYANEDDLERGASRRYWYLDIPRRNDGTPELPPDIGQIPMPYPDFGVQFSHGLAGHLALRLRVHGDDLWIKDEVDVSIREVSRVATSFDTEAWQEGPWQDVASFGQDVPISPHFPPEGHPFWNLSF